VTTYVLREGKNIKADEAFFAWTSGDLDRMVSALAVRTNPIDRHFLLMGIVAATYKKRKDPLARRTCIDVGHMHVAEFPAIAPALRADMGGVLPRVATFAHLATVLAEDGALAEAIAVCEAAIRHGLHDGTQADYSGRIERMRKRAARDR
jgi:hypothetical protein